jgi:hypothetical protein
MKIIGHSGKHHVLVEMERDEVARLMGESYESSLPHLDRFGHEKLPVGMVVKVSGIYNRLKAQERAETQLKAAAETLSALAALCVATVPQIESLGPEVQS